MQVYFTVNVARKFGTQLCARLIDRCPLNMGSGFIIQENQHNIAYNCYL